MDEDCYNALDDIIKYQVSSSGKLKNQVFAFGHFNKEKVFLVSRASRSEEKSNSKGQS